MIIGHGKSPKPNIFNRKHGQCTSLYGIHGPNVLPDHFLHRGHAFQVPQHTVAPHNYATPKHARENYAIHFTPASNSFISTQ
jgi:hypothetical protein